MKTSPGKTVLIVILSIIVIAAGIAGIIFSVKDKSKETKRVRRKHLEITEIFSRISIRKLIF